MTKKGIVVLAGGTGFVGEYSRRAFEAVGREVRMVSRRPGHIPWADQKALVSALEGADMLINLAGRSVDCRYNEANKREILVSRTETTGLLAEALAHCESPPPLWLNASTATIYRHAEDRPMTEAEGELGQGFSVGVARAWEAAFFEPDLPGIRRVALRMAIVLGDSGGVMRPLSRLVRLGLGGKQGSGEQKFSWLHVADMHKMMEFIEANPQIQGPVNCASPNPVNNRLLMQALRQAYGIPFGLPLPKWLLEFGAILIRTETELVLKSRWVLPQVLLEAGYKFEYPELEAALAAVRSGT